VIEALMESGIVIGGVFATSEQQRLDLWAVREAVLETIRVQGRNMSLDTALPLSLVAEFLERARPIADEAGLRTMLVGHLGDGNIHYAVTAKSGHLWNKTAVSAFEGRTVDLLLNMDGTFSAEHGIGRAKAHLLAARKDPAQIEAMRRIKSAIDPTNLFNPGVLFPDA
jgi:FAD/FMN-containing dehydrogenase